MNCPKCIAETGLAALTALNEGRDAHVVGVTIRPKGGKQLCHSTQAGIGRALLEQVASAGALCKRHRVAARRSA